MRFPVSTVLLIDVINKNLFTRGRYFPAADKGSKAGGENVQEFLYRGVLPNGNLAPLSLQSNMWGSGGLALQYQRSVVELSTLVRILNLSRG